MNFTKTIEQRRAEFLASLDEANSSLERGEGIIITPESMRALAEDVKKRGCERLAKMITAREMLGDVLAKGLDIVFVGMAAGNKSAAEQQYYAHPGNRFWKTIHEVGLTQRLYRPDECRRLLRMGFGFTDLCKTQAGMDDAITELDIFSFEARTLRVKPRAIVFNGKKAGLNWLRYHSLKWTGYGLVKTFLPSFPAVFILPSTSGANGHWHIEPWKSLERWRSTL